MPKGRPTQHDDRRKVHRERWAGGSAPDGDPADPYRYVGGPFTTMSGSLDYAESDVVEERLPEKTYRPI